MMQNKRSKSSLEQPLLDEISTNYFNIQNRRFLGNKYKLTELIKQKVLENCGVPEVICDIFAGTGVVGSVFNSQNTKVISNDLLYSNFIPLKAFLGIDDQNLLDEISNKIVYLNDLIAKEDNYFSVNYGGTYFTHENAQKIGLIRDEIENIADSEVEKTVLLTALLYATDKIANTVGHYDAYRANLDMVKPLKLLMPLINAKNNSGNEIYNEDANTLIKRIYCDVLYIDPPYNSRQYSDTYHLLENLAVWSKPELKGKAKKMDRFHLKSKYCLRDAPDAFSDLINNAQCKHIVVSYNNTGSTKDGRSNARITDAEITAILSKKGKVQIFDIPYKAYTTGKSSTVDHAERLFFCHVS